MDIVYIYKASGYKNPHYELEWSIKSLKNIKHENVYIVGDNPHIKGAIHLPVEQNIWSGYSKYYDQINKLLAACNVPEISEDLIAMNDDMFILRNWTPEYYHRESFEDHLNWRKQQDNYRKSLRYTYRYLKLLGLSTNNFELHTPMVFNKSKLKELILSLPKTKANNPQIRSIYGNAYKVPSTYQEDVKNKETHQCLISTSNSTFRGDLGAKIRSKI